MIPVEKVSSVSWGKTRHKSVSIFLTNDKEARFYLSGIDDESSLNQFRELMRKQVSARKEQLEWRRRKYQTPEPQDTRTYAEGKDSFEKGFAFEDYLITLFDKYPFRLFSRTKDKPFKTEVHTEADNLPDLTFRNLETNQKLFIEAKWRVNLTDGTLYIAETHSLERYREYSKIENAPCFIVVGLGGFPKNPNRMFLIPLSEITGPYLSPPVFQKFERSPAKIFSWDEFQGIPVKKAEVEPQENDESNVDKNWIEKQRSLYPKAYMAWSEQEDIDLKKKYEQGFSVQQLMNEFQRNEGAIKSRLKKLGLTQ